MVHSLLLPACAHSIYSPSTSPSLCHTHMQCESHTSPMVRYRLPSLSEDSEDSEQKEPAEEEEEEESSLSRVSTSLFKQVGWLCCLLICSSLQETQNSVVVAVLANRSQAEKYDCLQLHIRIPLTL